MKEITNNLLVERAGRSYGGDRPIPQDQRAVGGSIERGWRRGSNSHGFARQSLHWPCRDATVSRFEPQRSCSWEFSLLWTDSCVLLRRRALESRRAIGTIFLQRMITMRVFEVMTEGVQVVAPTVPAPEAWE